ncbi:SubName: Full=Uncharacterized protein {ECO:0000313/EMBL:CCA68085.1} [Serendipita indica DSM 11827]|nr:SubName: Full=Uncharacterized protein {ECO:0000313/EMBL:CCA68085.1} [Serendipita indica DSM 11827]
MISVGSVTNDARIAVVALSSTEEAQFKMEPTTSGELKVHLEETHNSLKSELQSLIDTTDECKARAARRQMLEEEEEKEKARRREKKAQNMQNLLSSLQTIAQNQHAQRMETIQAAKRERDDYQRIKDELELEHARMQNVIATKLAPTPSDSFKTMSIYSEDSPLQEGI